jgi:hypothetical protein
MTEQMFSSTAHVMPGGVDMAVGWSSGASERMSDELRERIGDADREFEEQNRAAEKARAQAAARNRDALADDLIADARARGVKVDPLAVHRAVERGEPLPDGVAMTRSDRNAYALEQDALEEAANRAANVQKFKDWQRAGLDADRRVTAEQAAFETRLKSLVDEREAEAPMRKVAQEEVAREAAQRRKADDRILEASVELARLDRRGRL